MKIEKKSSYLIKQIIQQLYPILFNTPYKIVTSWNDYGDWYGISKPSKFLWFTYRKTVAYIDFKNIKCYDRQLAELLDGKIKDCEIILVLE